MKKKNSFIFLLIVFVLVLSGCPTPTTPLHVELTSTSNTITKGESVTFTSSPAGGAGSYNFSWFVNSIQVTEQNGSTFTKVFSTAGNYSVKVEVNDGEHLSSDTVTVTVEEPPELSITLSPSMNQAINEGTSINFSVAITNGSGSNTISWYIDTDVQTGQTTSTFSNTFDDAGTYTVKVSVNDGTETKEKSINVLVSVAPIALSIVLSPSVNQEIVEGTSVNFSVTTVGGSGTNSISWYIDTDVQAGQTTSTFSHTFATAGTFTVKVKVNDGTEVKDKSINVVVSVAPTARTLYVIGASDKKTYSANPGGAWTETTYPVPDFTIGEVFF